MEHKLSEERLKALNGFISSVMGLHFTQARLGDLERGISSAARDFGFDDEDVFIDWLKSRPLSKEHIERLAFHLTIGETYFLRDPDSFKALEQKILPGLIEARSQSRRIRVWSAGCSTGEEAYSVAILLKKLIPELENWNVSILATDINPRSLKKAQEGVYTEWSFRDTPQWFRELYFKQEKKGAWRIDPGIQKMVSFGYLNLAEDIYPSLLNGTNGVDIIFCRNVIMYFSDKVARAVVEGLSKSLVDDGWLLVSPAEAVRSISGLFAPVNMDGAIFYKKTGSERARELSVPEAAPQPIFDVRLPEPHVRPPEAAPIPEIKTKATAAAGKDVTTEAAALYEKGRYLEAASLMESLPGKDMGEGQMLLLARSYANLGCLEEASRWCESVHASDSLNKAAYILLATIRLEQARMEEAIKNLKKALYIDQDSIVAHFMLGKLLMSRAESGPQARRHFAAAHSLLLARRDDDFLPESDGMMAGRLREIISTIMDGGVDG